MTRVLGPELVPAGFTITTEACVAYMRDGGASPGRARARPSTTRSRASRRSAGRRLGDPDDPLLVSVRSGARDSMPGMMDTVLNLGLNDESVRGLAGAHRQRALRLGLLPPARADVRQRRAAASPARASRTRSPRIKAERGVRLDTELDADALRELTAPLPGALRLPARPARAARARDPRRLRLLDRATAPSPTGASTASPTTGARRSTCSRWSSATTGQRSGSGVAFSRDEVTGAPEPSGDFLVDAQGEDVVSGVRTPRDLVRARRLDARRPARGCCDILRTLERHYGDMQDTEFTVEDGRLYMLQTRSAKRPAQAAVRFAVDAVEEGLLTRARGDRDDRRRRARRAAAPDVRPGRAATRSIARGVAASPGAAKGAIVFTARGRRRRRRGRARGRSSCGRSPRPTTSPASTPPRASSPPRAARPRTRRSSRAAWAARR